MSGMMYVSIHKTNISRELADLDSIPRSWRSLLAVRIDSIREKSKQELVPAASHEIQQVFDK